MRSVRGVIVGAMIGIMLPIGVSALTYDVMIRQSDVTFQPAAFFSGDRVRVYAVVRNIGDQDAQGNVFFSENGTAIGTPPPFSVKARGAEEEVWVDWQPATIGDRQIFVRIVTAPETRDEDTTNNEMIIPVSVQSRAPSPPTPPVVPSPSSGGAMGTSGVSAPSVAPAATPPASTTGTASSAKRTDGSASRTTPRSSTPSTATIPPAPPKIAIAPAATNAPAPEPVAPSTPPAPIEAYDTQLRQLLGTSASTWRSAIPIIAGIVAIGALVALAFLLIRRRTRDDASHGISPPQVDRRARRNS